MAGGPLGSQGVVRRGWRDPERMRTLAITVLAVWAVAVSGALVLSSMDAASSRQVRLWTAQATVLVALHDGMSTADLATDRLLATGYVGFAADAVSALRGNGLLLTQLLGTPDVAAAEALNLNATVAQCIALGYEALEAVVVQDPSQINNTGFRQYVGNMGNGLGAVAALLMVRPDGTDPLGQIGAANIAVIRQDVVMMAALYAPSSACTAPGRVALTGIA